MNKAILLACVTAVVTSMAAPLSPAAEPTVTAKDLPRIKPTEPKDALKTFQVRPGFHLELAAAEPLVIDPIAMAFDADGRMFVIEMRDYSERRAEKLSRIRMLEDTDGDGVYDKATVFLDRLPWATALTCVNGGLLVGACPDVIFAKDTNGDGVADETKVVFTGFGSTQEKLNVQGLFNNFIWGPDNRIHGCSGHDGGMVQATLHPDRPPVDVRGKGFVIDPRDWSITTEAGGGQYGLSFDPWGRLFTCENSSHCEAFAFDPQYQPRNPHFAMPNPLINVAVDGPAAEVFRTSPEEPWRVIRTRWRVGGLVGGPIEGGGRSAGYFTGATGLTIYKGDAFGPDYVGDAFIGDAGGNLVHHKRVREEGTTFTAARPPGEEKIEFASSTDNWFRPVDFANAPDGTLYIADMYREVIEHPWSIPPQIKQFLDLNSGNDRGRIYRLAPDGFKNHPAPHLSQASTSELVALLAHRNAWNRETAARLLFERQDKSAIPLLIKLAANSGEPLGRVYALHALASFDALTPAVLSTAFRDNDPHVRECAVSLAPSIKVSADSLATDPAPRVRIAVALTTTDPQTLATIARRDASDDWTRASIASAPAPTAAPLFTDLWPDATVRSTPGGRQLLTDLAHTVGATNNSDNIAQLTTLLTSTDVAPTAFAVATGLLDGAGPAAAPKFSALFDKAAAIASDTAQAPKSRTAGVTLLGYAPYDQAKAPLLSLIGTRQPAPVAAAALAALGRFDTPDVATELLSRWPKFSHREADDAIALLTKRPARALALLQAIHDHKLPADSISAQQTSFLQSHPNPSVRDLARKLLVAPAAKREAVVEQFRPAASLTGDRAKGKLIYEQRCISCHRVEGEGNAVGPDLVTVKNSGKEKLLLSILDPSREIAANYVAYQIETKDGETLVGIISNDTTSSITVRQAYGKETTLPRSNIKSMTSHGKSLMPDGLESGLTPQSMADLLEFISTAQK